MTDVYHYWGNDLGISSRGGLEPATEVMRSQQRVLRRLLTNPGQYVFHPEYGAGLAQWVGSHAHIPSLKATIREQIHMEDSVARTPAPIIELTKNFRTLEVKITYVESSSGNQSVLAFSVDE